VPRRGLTARHRRGEQGQGEALDVELTVGVLRHQPGALRRLLADQIRGGPAVGLEDLLEPVAVAGRHLAPGELLLDGAVEGTRLGGVVLGGHGDQLGGQGGEVGVVSHGDDGRRGPARHGIGHGTDAVQAFRAAMMEPVDQPGNTLTGSPFVTAKMHGSTAFAMRARVAGIASALATSISTRPFALVPMLTISRPGRARMVAAARSSSVFE
jgi:hypothetical protein